MTRSELRALVAAAGLTGNQVAALLGVDPTTYWRWASGRSRIPKAAWELLQLRVAQKEPGHE